MDNEKLLDEIESYLEGHGTVFGVQFSEASYLHRIKAVREEIKRQTELAALVEVPAAMLGAKEEKKVARQFYYRTDGCNAKNSHDPDCICWHDEGDRLQAILADVKLDWRDKPDEQL